MIKLENVTKTYECGKESVNAINNVSLQINDGDFVAITGPSGSGKTTLLNIIGMMDCVSSGNLIIDGKDFSNCKENERCLFRKEKLGFVFQNFALVSVFNVYENVESSLLISEEKITKKEKKEKVMKFLKLMGLEKYKNHLPSELSGGQKQRVAIARALIKSPAYIIADEPTANLDTKNAFGILKLMKKINEVFGTTFIISTHDDRLIKNIQKRIHLVDGAVAESGIGAGIGAGV